MREPTNWFTCTPVMATPELVLDTISLFDVTMLQPLREIITKIMSSTVTSLAFFILFPPFKTDKATIGQDYDICLVFLSPDCSYSYIKPKLPYEA